MKAVDTSVVTLAGGGLLGLVVVVALVVLLILLITGRRGRRWARLLGLTALAGLAVLVLVFVAFFWAHSVSVPQVRSVAMPSSLRRPQDNLQLVSPVPASTTRDPSLPPAWQPSTEQEFQADIYPSQRAAALALVDRLMRSYLRTDQAGHQHSDEPVVEVVEIQSEKHAPALTPAFIRVRGSAEPAVLTAVANAALAEFPRARLDVLPNSAEPVSTQPAGAGQSDTMTLQVDTPKSFNRGAPVPTGQETGGTVEVMRIGPGAADRQTLVADWIDKPWVEDVMAFQAGVRRSSPSSALDIVVDATPPNARWIVGYSEALCTNSAEASEQALHAAAGKLVPEIRRGLQMDMGNSALDAGRFDEQSLQDAALRELRDRSRVADTFTQRFQRPYGDLYRTAVLVDTSADTTTHPLTALRAAYSSRGRFFIPQTVVDSVVVQYTAMHQSRQASWARHALAAAGLAILICVVYLFLNAATKGYYTGALRVLAIVIVAGGLLLVLTLA